MTKQTVLRVVILVALLVSLAVNLQLWNVLQNTIQMRNKASETVDKQADQIRVMSEHLARFIKEREGYSEIVQECEGNLKTCNADLDLCQGAK